MWVFAGQRTAVFREGSPGRRSADGSKTLGEPFILGGTRLNLESGPTGKGGHEEDTVYSECGPGPRQQEHLGSCWSLPRATNLHFNGPPCSRCVCT